MRATLALEYAPIRHGEQSLLPTAIVIAAIVFLISREVSRWRKFEWSKQSRLLVQMARGEMRTISVIGQPGVIKKILQHWSMRRISSPA
jgi:hypothetical protein